MKPRVSGYSIMSSHNSVEGSEPGFDPFTLASKARLDMRLRTSNLVV